MFMYVQFFPCIFIGWSRKPAACTSPHQGPDCYLCSEPFQKGFLGCYWFSDICVFVARYVCTVYLCFSIAGTSVPEQSVLTFKPVAPVVEEDGLIVVITSQKNSLHLRRNWHPGRAPPDTCHTLSLCIQLCSNVQIPDHLLLYYRNFMPDGSKRCTWVLMEILRLRKVYFQELQSSVYRQLALSSSALARFAFVFLLPSLRNLEVNSSRNLSFPSSSKCFMQLVAWPIIQSWMVHVDMAEELAEPRCQQHQSSSSCSLLHLASG